MKQIIIIISALLFLFFLVWYLIINFNIKKIKKEVVITSGNSSNKPKIIDGVDDDIPILENSFDLIEEEKLSNLLDDNYSVKNIYEEDSKKSLKEILDANDKKDIDFNDYLE